MKITFLGLSCFLIENKKGYQILVDPFDDSKEWTLGPTFPKKINNKPIGANIVLMSEPDADHSRPISGYLQNAPQTKPNSNPFPNLNLKGTIIYEFNGDLNIAWHYTVDTFRIAHLADNAHLLTKPQLKELGNPDILFISPQKVEPKESPALKIVRKNIAALKPKVVVWSHHITPINMPKTEDFSILRTFFANYFAKNANTNKYYKNEKSFIELCYVLENAIILNKEYNGTTLNKPFLEIKNNLKSFKGTKSFLFKSMLAK